MELHMSGNNEGDLEAWIAQQAQRSALAMERAISATHLVRTREAFGQTVVPAKGSVLASPEIAEWNPEPDYFFHWLRDSAIVMRSVAELMQDASSEAERGRWRRHFEDFIVFSLSLGAHPDVAPERHATRREFRKFLRTPAELRALGGDRLLGEPRFNPDGTIDIFRWSRPQYDGPALRALACLRYLAAGAPRTDALARLLRMDLNFTLRHAGRRCIGPWEERSAHHYYVALVQLGALVHGRDWADDAEAWNRAERRLRSDLDRHWSEPHQVYAATRPINAENADDLVDAAELLAVLDADLPEGRHSVADPRVQSTQKKIEDLFAREFPINRRGPGEEAPAIGRYRTDKYFGGGAWYPTTLAVASLCFRLAKQSNQDRAAFIKRGDAFMTTIRALTPADGTLSEQVDRVTGAQTSARNLTWSYAAFIGAARLRRQALGAHG
jgi:glucoamylase